MAALSSGQDYSVDDFFKERLKSCHVNPKGMITGYVDSKPAYDELMYSLKVLGCRYSVRSTGKTTESANLQFKLVSPDVQIPFTGTPFHTVGTTYFLCTHGIRYFRSKISQDGERKDCDGNPSPRKRQRKVNESIKIGCPAKMTVKSIRVYPDYKTSADSWRRKSDLLKRLKADLKASAPPRFELHYWIAVSQETAHTHERTTSQRVQTLHPDLISEIHSLVKKGVTSVPVVKTKLSSFVDNMFENSSVHPEPSNTAFYPTDKAIYNHIHEAKSQLPPKPQESRVKDDRNMTAVSADNVPSAPCQDHPVSEKCDSDLAVVPVFETFSSDWPEHAVLPANLVQVLNNNGALMFMVTQPLGDEVVDRVGNPTIESSPNPQNVNLEDNIYRIITDPSEQRILQLNSDSSILMSQHCTDSDEMREVLNLEGDPSVINLESLKSNDMHLDRVIVMENSVIMGVPNSSSADCKVEDGDGDDACQDDANEFLFVEDDSQTNLIITEVKSQTKELTDLCALQSAQSLKEEEANIFSNALENQEADNNLNLIDGYRESVKKSKSRKRTRRNSDVHVGVLSEEVSPSILKSLRDSAQDIIEMSYVSTNTQLLQEMARVFEKYRRVLHGDLEMRKKITTVEDVAPLSLSGKCRWKAISKGNEKTLVNSLNQKEDFQESSVGIVSEGLSRGCNIYSPEYSVDECDDLIIINE